MPSERQGVEVKRCPFPDCDWEQEYDPDKEISEMQAEAWAEQHYEIERAIMNGNRVVVHLANPDEVSKFVRKRPEIETTESLEEAVRMLTEPAERRAVADD